MDSGMRQTTSKTDFFHSSHKTISDNIVMWEAKLSIADWVYPKTQTLWATLKTRNQPPGDGLCVSLGPEHLSPSVGCARSNLPSRTVLRRVWNHFSGCWITYGWVSCSRSLGHSDWGGTFNEQHCPTQPQWHQGNLCEAPSQSPRP